MSFENLTTVAYKKGNFMRYTLWGLAAVCVFVLVSCFVNMMNGDISAAVPDGYRFAVVDRYAEGSHLRTTYYVYDDHVIVEDESFVDNEANRTLMIYDNVNTTTLDYDPDDVTEICELGACYERPKVLAVIKRVLARKVAREYIGF